MIILLQRTFALSQDHVQQKQVDLWPTQVLIVRG